jgi:hypothetical protein
VVNGFNESDAKGLGDIVTLLGAACDWSNLALSVPALASDDAAPVCSLSKKPKKAGHAAAATTNH